MKVDLFEKDEAISQAGTTTSDPVRVVQAEGYFSLLIQTSGAGTLKIEYECSDTQSGTFITPSSAGDIASAHAAGDDIYTFTPPVCEWLRIKITENNVGTVTLAKCTLMFR